MKKFETPELELATFEVEAVLTGSSADTSDELGDNQTGPAIRPN